MNIGYYLLIGFSLTELGILVCRGETVCPNQPVTPYPIPKTITGCPNQLIPAYPIEAKYPPVGSCPTIPTQSGCCFNQETNPCTLPTSSPHCSCPCPVIQANPPPTYNCINLSCSSNPCGVSSNTPCTLTNSGCGSTNNCCGEHCCKTGNPPGKNSPSETRPTIHTPPPETLIKCPSGTQLIGKECHLIYCPRGSQMVNDRCVVIECPEGTVWTGHRCSVPEPIVQNIRFFNTVTTQFNKTTPDIILYNTNNIVVNASLTIHDDDNHSKDCNNDYGDCEDGILTTPPTKLECCVVMTPRMCKHHNNRWHCYSRRSRRCGEFCVAPIIYLKTFRIHARTQFVVMPPIQNNCKSHGNCGPVRDDHDCSGCAMNYMDRCSHYCYRYSCPSRRCDFYDQEKYCAHNAGSYGCQEEDGCFDDWCL